MKRKILAVAIVSCAATIGGCKTVQTTWDQTKSIASDHRGLITGCVSGAILGYAAKGDKGALLGLAAGCGIGQYYDVQRKKMKDLAQEAKMDVVIEEVEVSVLDTDNKTHTKTKMLSSSFVDDAPMFKIGSSALSPAAKQLVVKLAENYKSNGTSVMAVGHSDSSGSSAGNKRLSENRAKAVADLLAANGVPRERIYYQGAGESQPIAPNSTPEGRNLNRRVEFVELGAAVALQKSEAEVKELPKEVSDRSFVGYASEQQTQLRNVAYRDEVSQNVEGGASIDFGGETTSGSDSPLYVYLGEPESPTFAFSLFQKAYADQDERSKRYSCANSEPAVYGEVKSLSGKVETVAQHEYVPGMNGSIWLSKVNGHLVSLSGVKVVKDNFEPVGSPQGAVYKGYSGQNKDAQPDYKGKTVAETFEGNDSFLYRVYFNGKGGPLECIDLVMPKHARKSHEAIAGLIYYQDSGKLKSADYKPRKI